MAHANTVWLSVRPWKRHQRSRGPGSKVRASLLTYPWRLRVFRRTCRCRAAPQMPRSARCESRRHRSCCSAVRGGACTSTPKLSEAAPRGSTGRVRPPRHAYGKDPFVVPPASVAPCGPWQQGMTATEPYTWGFGGSRRRCAWQRAEPVPGRRKRRRPGSSVHHFALKHLTEPGSAAERPKAVSHTSLATAWHPAQRVWDRSIRKGPSAGGEGPMTHRAAGHVPGRVFTVRNQVPGADICA